MQAAPLWHPVQCQFVGLLTVTDFIDILRHYRNNGNGNNNVGGDAAVGNDATGEKQQQQKPKDVSELAVKSIAEILTMAVNRQQIPARSFWGAESTCTLYSACRQLLQTGQDFLPIVYAEDMRVLACITYTTVLEHLVTHFREQRRLFDDSITDLGIGTYQDDLISVTPDQSLSDALQLMARHNLSALPVVILEDDGPGRPPIRRITGVYSRSDITFLTKATDAEDAVRNLDLPLSEILTKARQDVTTPDALQTCSPQHTLQAIFESFAQVRFHRLYVVADEAPIISHPLPHLHHVGGGDTSSQNSVASHQTSGSVQQQQQHVQQQQQHPRLLGVVSAKDLVAYFLKDEPQQGQ
jgi:5'-AMP-activated protein kinase, regulatory gamma subunit